MAPSLATSISFLPHGLLANTRTFKGRSKKLKETLPQHAWTAFLTLSGEKTLLWTPSFHCFHHFFSLWSYKCYMCLVNCPAISKIPFKRITYDVWAAVKPHSWRLSVECRGQNGDPCSSSGRSWGMLMRGRALLVINILAPQGTVPVLISNQSVASAQLWKIWKLRKKHRNTSFPAVPEKHFS